MVSTTINSLPMELLSQVFSFLDSPAPSDVRLHDLPHADMLLAAHTHPAIIKNVALVNSQWRAAALPLLFRSALWHLDESQLTNLKNSPLALEGVPLLLFLAENQLAPYVKSLTIVTTPKQSTADGRVGLYRRGDRSGSGPARDLTYNEGSNELWRVLFKAIDPLRVTIIAAPRVLASLMARMIFLGDEWSFNQSHHILSLSRDHLKKTREEAAVTIAASPRALSGPSITNSALTQLQGRRGSLARPTTRVPCELFTLRPWTRLLLNEGSSIPVYKTYEFFHKQAPSTLGALLGAGPFPNDEALIPATVRELSYVAIFPLSVHVHTLVKCLPRIDRLFIQLVPQNNMLNDRREMAHLDMHDLWLERNSSYTDIMTRLFDISNGQGNWKYLDEFESGDTADAEYWDTMVLFVESNSRRASWRISRTGLITRGSSSDRALE
ncbi:F-box domain-containing protein [Coniella lustricola]|uniref:F-box domain-containing protein n=1 Tax=Coniella lustricola TaxID=2025994 RepID=A0A2T3A8U2_9PEZI|nr:F-box domain-containing protein [Coniella lustricola]